MGPPNGAKGQMMAFKVKPQSPANNEPVPRVQGVFRGSNTGQLNVRFKKAFTDVPSPNPSIPNNTPSPSIQFASHKTTVSFTERKDRSGMPPTKKRKTAKYPRTDTEPTLTTRRPISAYVPLDAWALIFKRCHPKFLIQARLVCRDFRDILVKQAIWREARRSTYGSTIPDCPRELTEFQYANLLVGRGCQIRPCTQRLTRKVYWAFMLRMCEQCFNEKVRLPEMESEEAKLYAEYHSQLELEVRQTIPIQLAGLLPAGSMWAGRFSQIRSLDRDQQMWRFQDESQLNYCIIADDYEALRNDFRQKVISEPSYFLFWARLQWSRTKERIMIARELDGADYDFLERPLPQRLSKIQYFRSMAEKLDPPMHNTVLEKMAAYHKAIDTPNAGSLRSWDLLAAKIDDPELREQAEKLLRWEREERHEGIWRGPVKDSLYDILARHRGKMGMFDTAYFSSDTYSSEQQAVLDVAKQELVGLLDIVHDEDVLLMLLDNTRRSYEAMQPKPQGLNGDGREGEYRLLLDDARMVVADVLMPAVNEKGSVRIKKLTSSLRCIGCTRTDCHKTYTFENLIIHIRNVHARRVGKNLHFYEFAVPVQSRTRRFTDPVSWYQIPWPKSMPALPRHRRAVPDMFWDPEIEQEYIEHKVEDEINIFTNVQPLSNVEIPANDFAGNFCNAIKTLLNTRLDSIYMIKLGLEYANRRRQHDSDGNPSSLMLTIAQLQHLEAAVKLFTPKVEFKFKCGRCVKDPQGNIRGRQPRETLHPQPLTILVPHWEYNKHRFEADEQLPDLIALPSDFELHQALVREDAKLSAQKNRAKLANKRSGIGGGEDDFGKQDPRAVALLEIPSAQSRFDLLFVPGRKVNKARSPSPASSFYSDTDDERSTDTPVRPPPGMELRHFLSPYEETHLPEEELVTDEAW